MSTEQIRERYINLKKKCLDPLSKIIENRIKEVISHPRIEQIGSRAKAVESFVTKAMKKIDGNLKYRKPFEQIQDQIGARIVVYYKADVIEVEKQIMNFFRSIEEQTIIPDEPSQFGYIGRHLILFIPEEIIPSAIQNSECITFFELQIKTLFQNAWSQAEHDITYKTHKEWSVEQKRKIAFIAAQAWGADEIFDEFYNNR